jgi:hypothetical protein
MDQQPSPTEQPTAGPPAEHDSTRLHGRALVLARAAWIVIACVTLLLMVAGFPLEVHQSPSPEYQHALAQLGLPASFLLVYRAITWLLIVLVFFAVAVVIFWLRSDERMAIFTSLMLMTFGTNTTNTLYYLLDSPQPGLKIAAQIVLSSGLASLLVFIYIFPNGRFVPPWTRPVSILYSIWIFASFFWPKAAFSLNAMPEGLSFAIHLGLYGSSVYAQAYRQNKLYTPVEHQQTKWVMAGLGAALIGFIITSLLNIAAQLGPVNRSLVTFGLVGQAVSVVCLSTVPLSIGLSILRYRLWDIDLIIHRTLIYGVASGLLGLAYFVNVLALQWIFQKLTGHRSDVAIVASTLIIAGLFQPVRRRVRELVDRHFYREKVDFQQAFANFAHEVRAMIELPDLVHALVTRVTDLLHITYGAVFLRDGGGTFQLAEGRKLPTSKHESLVQLANPFSLGNLKKGETVSGSLAAPFSLLVPLLAPRAPQAGKDPRPRRSGTHMDLIGVLALGPRLSGQDYSRDDRALLSNLADQVGTAIYVAGLIMEKQDEARQKEHAERQLEAYRNSPIGRAEAFAQRLLAQSETALVELHRLAQAAGHEPEAASMIGNLPQVLGHQPGPATPQGDSAGESGQASSPDKQAAQLASLAEGFNYVFSSHSSPELLPLGLRTLVTSLPGLAQTGLHGAAQALAVYRACQAALEANSISQILEVRWQAADVPPPSLPGAGSPAQESQHLPAEPAAEFASPAPDFLDELANTLALLEPVANALRAYERVDTSQDKLAYLASAVERLRHVAHAARTGLEGADRSITLHIVDSWTAVVTAAMSELQTRAQLVCQLLTRRTWVGDVISLALSVRNQGRGAALNLHVSLAPMPECTLLDEAAPIKRLAPGEEAQVELRVRPRLEKGVSQFRARFVIHYADPRGSDQVEHFADIVHLLSTTSEFQFVPNPYVVGTPLQPGSPLFFGREDVIAFIQDNLASAHRNNLVLIGQRRTGKTSLLKQLSLRLDQSYVPVYLDGQSLALDPGLSNFFLSLATEIVFALEDRGFSPALPEPDDLGNSPAAYFERSFLAHVRATIGERHLLLLLDEFEELEASVRRGNLDASVFGFLRHLIQHTPNLSVIFCGTHRLEELSADYWSVLFNISLYRHVAYLDQPQALKLIQEPVASYGMCYDDLALDKMWRVTAGHPYFLQLLCHSLVNRHNKTERSYVTVADVNAALEDILASGEAHFVYLWADSALEERLALTALSRMMPLTDQATPVQVLDYLAERGVTVERQSTSQALHRLALRDILSANTEADATLGESYRWKLGLLGLWVEKYKSLSRVVDEVEGRHE